MNKTSGALLLCALMVAVTVPWLWPRGETLVPEVGVEGPVPSEADRTSQPAVGAASRASVRPLPRPRPEPAAAGAHEITGVVVAAEQPRGAIAGARVTLRLLATEPDELLATEESDAEGRFRFSAVKPAWGYVVRAEASGFVPAERNVASGDEVRLTLTLGSALSGTVTDADHGVVAGVRLSLQVPRVVNPFAQQDTPVWAPATNTDAQGRYRLTAIPRQPGLQLWLQPRGGHLPESRLLPQQPGEHRLDIELARVVPLHCQVLDARDQSPIAGAEVRCDLPEPIARSGADGTLTLQVPPGVARELQVGATGYAPIEHRLTLEGPQEHPLVLLLPRGARVTGRVVDANGTPVAGARLTLAPVGLPPGRAADRKRAVRAALPRLAPGSAFLGGPWRSSAVADAQGRFAFEGVAGREGVFHGELVARCQGFCDAGPAPVDVDLPALAAEVNLTQFRGGWIEGTLRHQGNPVCGYLSVRMGDWTTAAGTNALGEFVVGPIPPGEVTLTAYAHETTESGFQITALGFAMRKVEVTEGSRLRQDLDLDGAAPGQTTAMLEGRVTDAEGNPVASVPIRVDRDDPGGSGASVGTTATRVDGRWHMMVPTAGGQATYTVSAQAGGFLQRHERVRPPRHDLTFELSGKGRVTLEVTCADGGSVSGVNVFARPASGGGWNPYQKDLGDRGSTTVLDANEVLSLPVGEVDLRIDVLGYLPTEVRAVRVTTSGGEPVRVVVHRGRTLTLTPTGEVDALDQREVVLVRADSKLRDGPLPSGYRTLRRDEGRLTTRTLAPGRYRLVSTDRDLVFDPELIEIGEQDVAAQVRITVRK